MRHARVSKLMSIGCGLAPMPSPADGLPCMFLAGCLRPGEAEIFQCGTIWLRGRNGMEVPLMRTVPDSAGHVCSSRSAGQHGPQSGQKQTSCWRMQITSGICNDSRHGSVWSLQAETGSTVSTALRVTARRVSSSRPSSTAPHRVVATSVPREPSCSLAGNGWEVQANIETNLMIIGMFLFDAGESGVGKLRRAEEASGLQSPTNSQLGLPPTVDLCPVRA